MDSIIVIMKNQSLLQGIFEISGESGSLYYFSYTSHVIYKLIVLCNNDVRFWENKVLKDNKENDRKQVTEQLVRLCDCSDSWYIIIMVDCDFVSCGIPSIFNIFET